MTELMPTANIGVHSTAGDSSEQGMKFDAELSTLDW